MIRVIREVNIADIIETPPNINVPALVSFLRDSIPNSEYFENGMVKNAFWYHSTSDRVSTIFLSDSWHDTSKRVFCGMSFDVNTITSGGRFVARVAYKGTLGKMYLNSETFVAPYINIH